ncbi:putative ribonuclease H protein [Vitis vinifera]|uniref:Putative ribonuclease H protein n=1 Tax=Vitis vinifera TaxID=29760 RepID=A0A438FHR4_VITVI|nr:putative ribonuclease H protein [Vitis vinifera]
MILGKGLPMLLRRCCLTRGWRPSVSGLQFEMLELWTLMHWRLLLWKRRYLMLSGAKKVVGKVVSKAQGAFVEGRQILDAVLIANEAIDSTLKNNESGILCKLDIEKAYDKVDWNFILTIMKKMGLGRNGLGGFSGAYPLQGSRGRFLSGCRVKGRSEEGVLISHLLFADDTLVFCKPSQDQLTYLSWLLMWFEAVSGLRINLEKSELIPVGRVESMDDLAGILAVVWVVFQPPIWGCPWVLLLSQLQFGMVWKSAFEEGTMWKRQYLSKGGRATLIRSTLSNLPIYLMSLLCLPSSVRRRLEKIQRDFLWGGGNLDHKPHLVRWELVC